MQLQAKCITQILSNKRSILCMIKQSNSNDMKRKIFKTDSVSYCRNETKDCQTKDIEFGHRVHGESVIRYEIV